MKLHYFPFFAQGIQEEARATIIQTILAATCFGVSMLPNARIEGQFKFGLNVLKSNSQNAPKMHIRERAVLNFVKQYAGEELPLPKVRSLLDYLYRLDIDTFLRSLNNSQKATFNKLIAASETELVSRDQE